MSNGYKPDVKDSQFAVNVHSYLNNLIGGIINMYYKSLPEGTNILRIGHNIDKDGKYVRGSISNYVRADTEEVLFKLQINNKSKPILYLK